MSHTIDLTADHPTLYRSRYNDYYNNPDSVVLVHNGHLNLIVRRGNLYMGYACSGDMWNVSGICGRTFEDLLNQYNLKQISDVIPDEYVPLKHVFRCNNWPYLSFKDLPIWYKIRLREGVKAADLPQELQEQCTIKYPFN